MPWTDEQRDKILIGHVPIELSTGLHELLGFLADTGTNALPVAAVPESMETQFSEFVPLADVIEIFGLDDMTPNLLNAARSNGGKIKILLTTVLRVQ